MATFHRIKPHPAPKRRVLVVEDDLDSVHSMALLIKMMGHEVQFAINGMAAIDIARTFRPDIIILDIGLPDFKGDHIARQLRFEPGLENTQLIAISGLPEEHLESRALHAGFNHGAGRDAVLAGGEHEKHGDDDGRRHAKLDARMARADQLVERLAATLEGGGDPVLVAPLQMENGTRDGGDGFHEVDRHRVEGRA